MIRQQYIIHKMRVLGGGGQGVVKHRIRCAIKKFSNIPSMKNIWAKKVAVGIGKKFKQLNDCYQNCGS